MMGTGLQAAEWDGRIPAALMKSQNWHTAAVMHRLMFLKRVTPRKKSVLGTKVNAWASRARSSSAAKAGKCAESGTERPQGWKDEVLSTACEQLYSRNKVQKACQGLVCVVPHVTELHHHLLLQLVINDRDGERGGFVSQEVPIVCALEVQLQVWKRKHSATAQGLF